MDINEQATDIVRKYIWAECDRLKLRIKASWEFFDKNGKKIGEGGKNENMGFY